MAIDYEVVSAGPIAPGKFRCRATAQNSVSYDDMVTASALRVNVTREQMKAAIDGFLAEAYEQVLLGNSAQFGELGSLFASIRQTLNTQDGGFDPSIGFAGLTFTIASGWQAKLESEASFNKVAAEEVEPQILNVFDVATAVNNNATRNNIVRVTGSRLAFDVADVNQGVFFQPAIGSPVRATVYESIGDRIIVLLVPGSLAAAPHTLLVKAKYTPTGTLRTGTYNTAVAVL